MKLRLDTAQNQLLFADFFLFIVNSCLGFGNYFVGIFGMNLDNTIYLQPRYGSFVFICIVSLVLVILLYVFIFLYFKWTIIIPVNYKMMQVLRGGHSLIGSGSGSRSRLNSLSYKSSVRNNARDSQSSSSS